ncbi:MAG: type VII toxin-antitoxin system HepT family RNase toxin [Bacillota bacterium]
MVEVDVVERKLKQLDQYLKQLAKYQSVTLNEIEGNMEKAWIIERGLQLSIQVILDIGNHILADEGIAVEEYTDIFVKLADLGIIPREFTERVKGMAGFRNILVHEYGTIDFQIVVDVMNNNLEDFRIFAGYVVEYIDSQ